MPLSDMCEYSYKSTIFSKKVVLIRFKYLREHHVEKIRTASFLSTTMLRSEAISLNLCCITYFESCQYRIYLPNLQNHWIMIGRWMPVLRLDNRAVSTPGLE